MSKSKLKFMLFNIFMLFFCVFRVFSMEEKKNNKTINIFGVQEKDKNIKEKEKDENICKEKENDYEDNLFGNRIVKLDDVGNKKRFRFCANLNNKKFSFCEKCFTFLYFISAINFVSNNSGFKEKFSNFKVEDLREIVFDYDKNELVFEVDFSFDKNDKNFGEYMEASILFSRVMNLFLEKFIYSSELLFDNETYDIKYLYHLLPRVIFSLLFFRTYNNKFENNILYQFGEKSDYKFYNEFDKELYKNFDTKYDNEFFINCRRDITQMVLDFETNNPHRSKISLKITLKIIDLLESLEKKLLKDNLIDEELLNTVKNKQYKMKNIMFNTIEDLETDENRDSFLNYVKDLKIYTDEKKSSIIKNLGDKYNLDDFDDLKLNEFKNKIYNKKVKNKKNLDSKKNKFHKKKEQKGSIAEFDNISNIFIKLDEEKEKTKLGKDYFKNLYINLYKTFYHLVYLKFIDNKFDV